jgi:translation initiation factor 2B subunit (eIF-2B alpha/beta/delta family)
MALIHPAIKDLGLKYAERTITGSNARCVAMLSALKTVSPLSPPACPSYPLRDNLCRRCGVWHAEVTIVKARATQLGARSIMERGIHIASLSLCRRAARAGGFRGFCYSVGR